MPVSFIAHTVIMVLLSCKLQLVCFFMFCTFCFAVFPFIKQQMESVTPTRCFWNPALCVHRESLLLIGCIFFLPPYQAELQEVVGEEEAEDVSSTSSAPAESSKGETPESPAAQVQYTLLLPNLKLTPSTCLSNGRFFCLLPVTEKKGKGNILPVEVL